MQWSFWLNAEAPNAKWKLNRETGGPNSFYDAGIHAIDMMIHLFQRPSMLVSLGAASRFPETIDNVCAVICSAGTWTEHSPQVNPYAEEVRDFVSLLAGGSTVATTVDEAHLGVAMLDAIERSSSSGLAVSLPEVQ